MDIFLNIRILKKIFFTSYRNCNIREGGELYVNIKKFIYYALGALEAATTSFYIYTLACNFIARLITIHDSSKVQASAQFSCRSHYRERKKGRKANIFSSTGY